MPDPVAPAPAPEPAAPKAGNEVTVTFNWMDLLFKLMSAAVIPLVLWGIKLENQQTTQDLRIQQLTEDLKETKGHATALVRLEEQFRSVNEKLADIKAILNKNPIP